jgi:hypothetical protein
MLVIDGKNNNDDGMFTGKNNIEDGILAAMMEKMKETMMENKKETMIASRIVVYKLRRNSAELHVEHKCVLGPRLTSFQSIRRDSILRNVDETQNHQGLVEGSKVKAFDT